MRSRAQAAGLGSGFVTSPFRTEKRGKVTAFAVVFVEVGGRAGT